jgi:Mg/Co/Ni transporter MgtE
MKDEEIYDIIVKHNYDDRKIREVILEHMETLKKRGEEYNWTLVEKGKSISIVIQNKSRKNRKNLFEKTAKGEIIEIIQETRTTKTTTMKINTIKEEAEETEEEIQEALNEEAEENKIEGLSKNSLK